MINFDGRFGHKERRRRLFLFIVIFIFQVTLIFSSGTYADIMEELEKCANIKDKDKRLECYDKLAKSLEAEKAAVHSEIAENEKQIKISMMEKLWNLTDKGREDAPVIQWYHPNYFLFAAYNTTPNRNTTLDVDPNAKAQNTEAKFQLSGKVMPLPEGLLGKHIDLWIGYTQLSFWQLYNSPFSSPFRDTNYTPEGFFTYKTKYEINLFGHHMLDLRIVNFGFVHQSNGRARPLSRSWNRVFTEFGFEKVFDKEQEQGRHEFNLFVKPWYRIHESSKDDDNPDIEKYMGHFEIQGDYYWNHCRFSAMLRNNLRASSNKVALQLDACIPWGSIPILEHIASNRTSFYVQYFNGYGECLLDYNSNSNRIGAGIMITNWE